MPTVKQNIGNATGAGSNATRFKKSAAKSASYFNSPEGRKGLRRTRQKAARMQKYGRNAES